MSSQTIQTAQPNSLTRKHRQQKSPSSAPAGLSKDTARASSIVGGALWDTISIAQRARAILRSSNDSYHVVFDRPVSWSKNMSIVAWASLMTNHAKLAKWFIMQCIKQASTLRVSRARTMNVGNRTKTFTVEGTEGTGSAVTKRELSFRSFFFKRALMD